MGRFAQSSTGDWAVEKLFGDPVKRTKGDAHIAGFRCGDIIVAINEKSMSSQLSGMLGRLSGKTKFTIKRHDARAAVMEIHNCTMHVDKCIGKSRVMDDRAAIYKQLPNNPRRHEVYEQVKPRKILLLSYM